CLGLQAEYKAERERDDLKCRSHVHSSFFCVRIALLAWPRQTLCFQPIVEVVDPVVARFALLAHAPAMPSGAIDMKLGFVSGGFEGIVESNDLRSRESVVLRHLHEEGRHVFWYRRHRKRR